jgi:hypothetical protein
MADNNKAIVAPKKGTKVQPAESLEAAAKKLKRNSATVRQKQKKLAEGDAGRAQFAFFYADGRTKFLKTTALNVRTMLLPEVVDGHVMVEGKRVAGTRFDLHTKPVRVSFGRKSVTVKGKKKLTQAWKQVPVPLDATFLDIVHWVKAWKKKPALIRYGRQDLVMDAKRARSGAGAVR